MLNSFFANYGITLYGFFHRLLFILAAITTSSGNYNRSKYTTGTNDRALRHRHEDAHMY